MTKRAPEPSDSERQTAIDLPATPTRRRKHARSRAFRARGWEWLDSDSIRCRKRGRYADGRPFVLRETVAWLGSEEATIAEAERVSALQRAEALRRRTGQGVQHRAWTLEAWRAHARQGRRIPAWSRQDESVWRKWVRPRLGGADLRHLDAATLSGWFRWIDAKGKGAAVVLKAYYLARRVVQTAVAAQVIERVPWGDTPPPGLPSAGVRRRPRRSYSASELRALLECARERDAIGGGDLELRLATLADTGARPIEVAQLLAADVHVDEQGAWVRMHVAKQLRGKVKDLVRVISPGLARALLERFESLPSEARSLGLVFPRLVRGRWSGRWFEVRRGTVTRERRHQMFEAEEETALREAAGIFGAYFFRHTRNTHLSTLGTEAQVAVAQGYAIGSPAVRGYMDKAAIARGLPASFHAPIWPETPSAHAAPLVTARTLGRSITEGERRARVELDATEGASSSEKRRSTRGTEIMPLAKLLPRSRGNRPSPTVAPKPRGTAVAPKPVRTVRAGGSGLEQLALKWLSKNDDSQGEGFPLETSGFRPEPIACGFRFTENGNGDTDGKDPAEK